MTAREALAQNTDSEHSCGRCPDVEWLWEGVGGVGDHSTQRWCVAVSAQFVLADGWQRGAHLPTMQMIGSLCEIRAQVRAMIHDGRMFAGADIVHATGVRL